MIKLSLRRAGTAAAASGAIALTAALTLTGNTDGMLALP
jgi:hypothetical protein